MSELIDDEHTLAVGSRVLPEYLKKLKDESLVSDSRRDVINVINKMSRA